MRWLTNIRDPSLKDARFYVVCLPSETQEEAWGRLQKYLVGKIVGEPKATDAYSVAQLRDTNMVGIYSLEE